MGNINAKFNHLRRTKIISQMNKALLPLTEDDENFTDAAPSLFGREFAQKSKELVDQVRAMRSHLPGNKDSSSKPHFFQSVPPPQQQGGGGGGVPVQPKGKEERRLRIQTSHTRAETPVEQMNILTHAVVQNLLMIDFKSTLQNHLACLGIIPPKQVSYPLAGRLVHYQQEGNPGPLGSKHNPKLPDRLLLKSTSTCNTTLSPVFCGADSSDFRGNNRIIAERGNRGDSTYKATRQTSFLFPRKTEGNAQ